jgi:hypothetical protein
VEYRHDVVGIRVGQRLEQDRMDDAEDRRVGPNTEREREQGYAGKSRALDQPAEGVLDVLP